MGKVSKGTKCSVEGCDKEAIKSLSAEKARATGLKINEGRRAYLCKDHYKEYKRASKKDKIIEKWRKIVP
ncbi:MAG: hypothetical protein QXR62_03100 [Candidatus Bathyarchaeia archaeon]|nr:hypothetical protein [Candidatus Bathyarchaeota archaeon]